MNHDSTPAARPTLAGIFGAGLLAALPLAATLLIVVWVARLLFEYVGPDSLIGRQLVAVGLRGGSSEVVGYLLGVAFVIVALLALGLLVQTRLRPWLGHLVDALVERIPVVRSIYGIAQRLVELIGPRDVGGLQSMRPVWCHFGGPGGAAALGLLSCTETIDLGGVAYHAVLIPTSPVPVGGGLIYVPKDWVTPADIGIEALTSIYVSMGVTSTEQLKSRPVDPPG